MSELTPEQKLAQAVSKIEEAIADAIEIADETGIDFGLDVSYGMGGHYYPPAYLQSEDGEWLVDEYYLDADQGGWVASSQTC